MQNQNLRNHLAAEYVIGTLEGAARKRFEFYIHQDPSLQVLVQKWGHLLHPMGSMLKPVKPPKRVWKNIQQRLQLKNNQIGFWNNITLWRSFSVFGSAIAIIIGLYLGPLQPVPQLSPDYLAVVENAQSQGAWVISTDMDNNRLIVRNLKTQKIASNKDFELWLLPASNKKKTFKAPISVGLINEGEQTEIRLSKKLVTAIQQAGGVAVSLEPIGGSPTGSPTGPVLYHGKLQIL